MRLREFTTSSGVDGLVAGWCGRMETKAISAFNFVEVEVEAELGKKKKKKIVVKIAIFL